MINLQDQDRQAIVAELNNVAMQSFKILTRLADFMASLQNIEPASSPAQPETTPTDAAA